MYDLTDDEIALLSRRDVPLPQCWRVEHGDGTIDRETEAGEPVVFDDGQQFARGGEISSGEGKHPNYRLLFKRKPPALFDSHHNFLPVSVTVWQALKRDDGTWLSFQVFTGKGDSSSERGNQFEVLCIHEDYHVGSARPFVVSEQAQRDRAAQAGVANDTSHDRVSDYVSEEFGRGVF